MPLPVMAGLQVAGGILGALGSKSAAKKRERAIQAGIDSLTLGRNQAEEALAGRRSQEELAMGRTNALLGLTDEEVDFDLFRSTPGYEFALEEGSRARERSAAARGGLNSGNTLIALEQYGQGLADQTFDNYLTRVMQIQNQGVDFALADIAESYGVNVGNMRAGIGEARAAGIEGATNSLIGATEGVAGLYAQDQAFDRYRSIYGGAI